MSEQESVSEEEVISKETLEHLPKLYQILYQNIQKIKSREKEVKRIKK
jgi:hypothetical protein